MEILGICGYGYSGSGAVVDLLSGFDLVNYLKVGEFNLLYVPDGLEDLYYHLQIRHSRYISSDVAIVRFLKRVNRWAHSKHYSKEIINEINRLSTVFINQIIDIEWNGFWAIDYQDTEGVLNRIIYRVLFKLYPIRCRLTKGKHPISPERKMFLSINNSNFLKEAKLYISSILQLLGAKEDKINIIDQPFSADNPEQSFLFFDNPKAIIVDRDPRDVYILVKRLGKEARWIPSDSVDLFISYYKIMRDNESKYSGKDVLRIQFEDLIYLYDETKTRIFEFAGITAPSDLKTNFNPAVSINNTQLYNTITEEKLIEDIHKIESELQQYLFDFEKYDMKPKRNTDVF